MLKSLKLRQQLLLGFAVVIGLFVVAQLVVGMFLRQVIGDVTRIDQETLPFAVLVGEMDVDRVNVQQFLTDVAATHDEGGYQEAAASAQRFLAGVEKFKALYRANADHKSLAQIEAVEAAFNAFYGLGKKMAAVYVAQGIDAGNVLMKGADNQPGFDAASEKLGQSLDAFKDQQLGEARALTQSALARAQYMGWVMVCGVVVAALVGVLVGTGVAMRVLRVLGGEPSEAATLVREVGAGNLAVRANLQPGDTDSLMANLADMQARLAMVVNRIRGTSDNIATSAQEIWSGNSDLSTRTAGQAAALEEAATAMEEMSSAVESNAQRGQSATSLARHASAVAEKGGEVMAQVVSTMSGINEASRRISDIIGVIDGIAFQTNILALNAAVEAARAGEAGRGFAVVAGEVRSLAQRSAQAAKEIKDLITASVEQVGEGSQLVNHAGDTMTELVGGIKKVAELIGEISVASHEQAQGVGQLGHTVVKIDHDTQQNAALVEEMDAAATALNDHAQKLVHIVKVFKTA